MEKTLVGSACELGCWERTDTGGGGGRLVAGIFHLLTCLQGQGFVE